MNHITFNFCVQVRFVVQLTQKAHPRFVFPKVIAATVTFLLNTVEHN